MQWTHKVFVTNTAFIVFITKYTQTNHPSVCVLYYHRSLCDRVNTRKIWANLLQLVFIVALCSCLVCMCACMFAPNSGGSTFDITFGSNWVSSLHSEHFGLLYLHYRTTARKEDMCVCAGTTTAILMLLSIKTHAPDKLNSEWNQQKLTTMKANDYY